MNTYEILSILGALAWLPPIISLIVNLSKKPKLTIFCHKQLELGYTCYGPIVNLSLAFLGKNKTVLIDKIDLQLIHENNGNQFFVWEWFEEVLIQMDVPGQGFIPYKKNQQAIAIRVEKDQLVEKRIGFHQNTFKIEYDKLFKSVTESFINISSNGQDISALKASNPYNQLLDLYKNHFSWRVGSYIIIIKVYISGKKVPFEHSLSCIFRSNWTPIPV